jgi:hypothetical protein
MYIHLGNETVVRSGDIIGIFDMDFCSVSKRTREFLRCAEEGGRVINVTGELPKSFVVCGENRKSAVYISGVSPLTLKKRAADAGGSLLRRDLYNG